MPPFESNESFLESGKQTTVTPEIQTILSEVEGSDPEKIASIFEILKTLRRQTENKKEVFRKRTADQILKDGYITGCTDEALVFIALARASGIPAKYVETLNLEWLRKGGRPIDGHVYASVYSDGEWHIVDPTRKQVGVDIGEDGRVVMAMGLDSWDIGATDFESLKELSENFREEYLKTN